MVIFILMSSSRTVNPSILMSNVSSNGDNNSNSGASSSSINRLLCLITKTVYYKQLYINSLGRNDLHIQQKLFANGE